jgi:hypothetical protein
MDLGPLLRIQFTYFLTRIIERFIKEIFRVTRRTYEACCLWAGREHELFPIQFYEQKRALRAEGQSLYDLKAPLIAHRSRYDISSVEVNSCSEETEAEKKPAYHPQG